MNIEKNKKVFLNCLGIILGTKCNLKCSHCLGGDPKNIEIQPQYIDRIIDNITGIDEVKFMGFEISLYIDKIKMVFNKLIAANIRVNHITFLTNAVVFSQELADIFNDFRYNHTTKPNLALFQISGDKYHYNNGFTAEKLRNNFNRYSEVIKDCDYGCNTLSDGLYIMGRAKNLKINELDSVDKIICPSFGVAHYMEFRHKCEGEQNTCNNGNCIYNCVVTDIILLPNGYVFGHDMEAFNALDKDDYSFAIGHIEKDSLYDMVNNYMSKYNVISPPKNIVFKSKTYTWYVQYLLYEYLKFREATLSAFEKNNFSLYLEQRKKFIKIVNDVENKIKHIHEKDDIVYYNHITNIIANECKHIAKMGDEYFLIPNANKPKITNRIKSLYKMSPLAKENFKAYVGIEYHLYRKLWEYYENCDFEKYKETSEKILQETGTVGDSA